MTEGKINYSLDRPEYEFSTDTTQFDDELMKRGIITFEQAMIAKGASPKEARRLANIRYGKNDLERSSAKTATTNDDDENDDEDEDDDEEFLAQYRKMRLKEMQQESNERSRRSNGGEVTLISRSDWTREVNDASRDGRWVVITLTRGSDSAVISTSHVEACDAVEVAATNLAAKFPSIKFVSITASAANERWPPQNLPTMFCYRYGKLQQQLVGLEEFGGHGINTGRVEWRLAQLGVLETEIEFDPDRSKVRVSEVESSGGDGGRSLFGGMMSTWATKRDSEEDLSDID